MQAAFAQTDITPDFPVELIGCYRADSRSKGVRDPLLAQALLLRDRETNHCLIAIDSLGLTVALSNELRAGLAKQLQTDVSCVMLCYSHTHSAPAPLSPLNGERYFTLLKRRVEACVSSAQQALVPCRADWALTGTSIGENRREGCDMVDQRLGILRIQNRDTGRPVAMLFRVSAHANVLMNCNDQISSDYFGPARKKLEARFQCPAMLIQGASGNIKPAGTDKILGGDFDDLDRISSLLASSAGKAQFEDADAESTAGGVSMFSVPFSYRSAVPAKETAERIANEANTLCGIDGTGWLNECEALRNEGVSHQNQEGEIQFLFLNGGCICGVPDELFCEISLEAARRSHTPLLFLNGYTNGCTGYLPHAAEWVRGGYETLYSYLQFYPFHGHVMPFLQDTAERIVTLVCSEWARNTSPGA